MGDLELGAAIEAVIEVTGEDDRVFLEDALTAALPHIERAVIQRLIAKAVDHYGNGSGSLAWRAADAAVWLRAELGEGGGE